MARRSILFLASAALFLGMQGACIDDDGVIVRDDLGAPADPSEELPGDTGAAGPPVGGSAQSGAGIGQWARERAGSGGGLPIEGDGGTGTTGPETP